MIYIIEHLEPRLFSWCLIEYKHISKIVGRRNLVFTNLKTERQKEILSKFGSVYRESVRILVNTVFCKRRLCLLDPEASKPLEPSDTKKMDGVIFGGILGDNPPRKRTSEELGDMNIIKRNLGKEQMPTDNAVYTVKKIVSGKHFKELRFTDGIEIEVTRNRSAVLPFRYIVEQGKPLITKELIEKIRKGGF